MQQLQQAFEQQKQMQALQQLALTKQVTAPAISPLDILKFQETAQNHQDALDMKKQALDQQLQIAQMGQQGKIDLNQQKLDTKMANDQNLLAGSTDALDKQLQLVDKVLNSPGVDRNFGIAGKYYPTIPGSDAANSQELLKQLDATTFIGALGQMKNQSATGASGLGALSEREGDKVQSAQAALGRSQSYEAFQKNLANYKQELAASKTRLTAGFQNIYGQKQPSIDSNSALAELKRRGLVQ